MEILKQSTQTSTSIIWVNIIRLIAVFLVIIAHVEGWGNSPFWVKTFYYTLSRIGVPLFFLISGYLLLSKQESISSFLFKRFSRVIIPFFIWSIIYDVINAQSFQNGITVNEVLSLFIRIIRGPREGHLWFMYFLIGLYLLTPILRIFVAKAQSHEVWYFIFLWFLTMPFLNIIEALTPIKNGFEIYNSGGYLGYFLLGFSLANLENTSKILRLSWLLFIVGFIFTFIIFYYDVPPRNNELAFRSYPSLNIIAMSIGAFLLIKFASIKAPPLLIKFSSLVGKASFGIYLIHLLVLDQLFKIWVLFGFNPSIGNMMVMIPLVAIITFFFTWAIVFFIQKIPIIKHTV